MGTFRTRQFGLDKMPAVFNMSGAFSYTSAGEKLGAIYQQASLDNVATVVQFSAKGSNALFGKTNTNQNASLRLMAIIKA